jgi:hypothetical protein
VARLLEDWIPAFLDYTEHMEAPRIMRSWSAISAIASALRRKVWIDQDQFTWTPSLYIIFVGPPGVITKSTTTDLSSRLLRKVAGIKFGPNNITWQALATSFAGAAEAFEWPPASGEYYPMSAITLVSRELGSLLNPKDQDLVNLFIELYDGAPLYEKVTKMSGSDTVDSPWINLLGATTPSWIADNVPKSALGGGLISRCIFLYGDEKEKFVPYPKEVVRHLTGHEAVRDALVHDLEHIAVNLVGPFSMTKEAITWGSEWYVKLWTDAKQHYSDDKMMGYIARKQTHLHKVAMVLSASYKDELMLTAEDLQVADQMLISVEGCLDKVFAQIGRTEQSVQAEKFISTILKRGAVPYTEAYRLIHTHFPDFRDFEGVCSGAIRSGQIELWQNPKDGQFYLKAPNSRPLPEDNNRQESQRLPGAETETKTPNS